MTLIPLDVKLAFRGFAQRPAFTAVLVLTLGIGIGSNAAIFSVANSVLFQPLPYEDPEELALVWNRLPNSGVERALVSGPDFLDYRNETTLFEGFGGAFALSGTLTSDGQAEEVMVGWSTYDFHHIVGVDPVLGRNFSLEDAAPVDIQAFLDSDAPLPPGALLLSFSLWQQRFGSDPDVLGRMIEMDGQASFIVGVLPQTFRIYLPADAGMPTDIDAWRVLPENFAENARDAEWLTVVTRLKDGVTLERAQQEMDALATRLRELYQHHANNGMQIVLNSMHRDVVSHARPVLLALLGAAGFVLLIASANVANLLLVRAASRDGEIAVRAALGGGRGRIATQLLTESAVIASAGAALGLALAWWGTRALIAIRPDNLPRVENVGIDTTVLLFTVAATAVAALVFGTVPAARAMSSNLADSLRDRGGDSGGLRGKRIRGALVVTEVALSLALLIGAGLMLRSFDELRRVEPGFEAENVLTFSVPLPLFKYRVPEERADAYRRLHQQLSVLPGVEAVGAIAPLPLSGGDPYSIGAYGWDGATEDDWSSHTAQYNAIIPGYEEAMGLRLVVGRFLEEADNQEGTLDVVVVDDVLAERVWPDEDPLGKQLIVENFDLEELALVREGFQIVGVVEHVRSGSLAIDGRETLYLPHRSFAWLPLTFALKTAGDGAQLVPQVRREVAALDPGIPVANVRFMEEYVVEAMAETRFTLTLLMVFAAIALTLAAVGLYGVVSYSVRQRTQEIGVRMAFGAEGSSVVFLIVRQGMVLAAAGVVTGLVGAVVLTRVVASFLVGVSARDPITFIGIPVLLLAVAAVASYVPARRALGVDPVEALRGE